MQIPDPTPAKPRRFLMIFVRGSGSTLWRALMNQQPGIDCGREAMLTEEFFGPPATDTRYAGRKIKMKHAPDWARERLLEPGTATMFLLYRRDRVRHVIGLCRKNQLRPRRTHKAGKGNAWLPEDIVEPGPIPLEAFREELQYVTDESIQLRAFEQRLRDAGIPLMIFDYEDLQQDAAGIAAASYRWITGADDGFAMPSLEAGIVPVKNTSTDLREVTNLDELKHFVLTETDLPWID